MHISTLLYGGPGVGKTALATSSFWDFRKREPVEGRNGRLLLIGREENDALGIPDENIVRFPLPQNDPLTFAQDFELYLRALNSPNGKEAGITDIYAHLFVLYFGVLSMVTPPVALSSFTAAKIADANPIKVSLMSMLLAWPLYIFPFIFVWL